MFTDKEKYLICESLELLAVVLKREKREYKHSHSLMLAIGKRESMIIDIKSKLKG
jgi:hypothetical protein